MITLQVKTDGGKTRFQPGETVRGAASWFFDEKVRELDLRLFWYTQGRGERDVKVVESLPFRDPQAQESRDFSFQLPAVPFSFEGKLIALAWALELVAQPSGQAFRVDLAVSPTGEPVRLGEVSSDV